MDNMTIGPSMVIGGNTVQMTKKGKVQVTNPDGKIKTLSQDEFKKNLIKNADKINNGEEFEFKKDYSKGLRIAAAAVGTAAVTAGIIYRKELGKFAQKVWRGIKNLFKSRFDKNAPSGYSRDYRHGRRDELKETFKNYDGDAVVDGMKQMHSRKTFIPNKDNDQLIRKQKAYISEKNVNKRRKALLEKIRQYKEKGIEFPNLEKQLKAE